MTKSRSIIRHWSDAELELLTSLVHLNTPKSEIARQLGRSWWSIRAKAARIERGTQPITRHHEKPYHCPTDDPRHIRLVFAARADGFPVARSRPHFRIAA